ncbi:MAG: hypothetical protein ABI954_10920 [Pyrinomonadaceae bacterium]
MELLSPQIIEKVALIAPLGLRFHDAATGAIVGDGLDVSIYPANDELKERVRTAVPNRIGVYVLHRAAGLRNLAPGTSEEDFWNSNPPGKSFVVEVLDEERRFQPFQFTVNLPVRGVYQWENSAAVSPPGRGLSSIPLYSAPTRKVLGGMAVVRAEMFDAAANRTASFAVVEAHFAGRLAARGIADGDGKLALIFPQLPPNAAPLGSPPVPTGALALTKQFWQLDLTVKYQPSNSFVVASPPTETLNQAGGLPDLRVALAQNRGKIWADSGQTEELTEVTLRYGEELILRSRAAVLSPPDDTARLSKLFVSPAI